MEGSPKKNEKKIPSNIPAAVLKEGDIGPPSPGVDIHAVLGVPKPKRPSERSEEEDEDLTAAALVDETIDSDDDDAEDMQEGEYFNMEEADEEMTELQTMMLSENASLSRDMLVPIFSACTKAYEIWIRNNEASLPQEEVQGRRQQIALYRKVLDLYGSDAEWTALTHAQRVEKNKEAHEVSMKAKQLCQLPEAVSKVVETA